jgi:hypothetical protein
MVLGVALSLGACASGPGERAVVRTAPVSERVLPPTQVFFYPNAGQSPGQQDRDRYECYVWAVKQTGFDPSAFRVASRMRVEVVPMPLPGHDTAVGAVSGALIGAAVSRPRNAAGGAVVGAIAGAAIGAGSDSSRQAQAERIQVRYDRAEAQQMAELERRAEDYRRAMSACLEGRGYTVH